MKQNIKLIKKIEIATDTMAFYFEKPDGLEFRAGQFCDLTLLDPPETDAEGNVRGFSLVNAPFEDDIIVATRMRDTAFKRVLKDLPIGTKVEFDGPYGDFTLHKNVAIPAVFLIGGIGVTPVLSMIAQATFDKTDHKILLLHSSRTPKDLPFMAEFTKLAVDNPNFTYIPVASDGSIDDWKGEHGRIEKVMIEKYVEDLATPKYYLSGPAVMVKAMRELLSELGADEDNIRTEEFSGY
ncbi:FAD-dependent oxidoreductase [Candidatus Saccharibacteria bacterium]|nr:FAD-dependent oxidoreductase [Candidatus Saccharibacteria bacterium]